MKTLNNYRNELLAIALVVFGVTAGMSFLIPVAGAVTLLSLFDVI